MIVRELITRLGFEVDQASFAKAEKELANLRAAFGGQQQTAQQANAALAQAGKQARQAGAEAAKGGEETAEGMQKAAGGFDALMGSIGRLMASFGIGTMLHNFVELASDANETSNVLGELFGPEGRADVEEWSQTMGQAMGRSAYDLQAYASRLGSVLGPVTKSREQAEEMSKTLSGLAVDLGSFFNTTDQDAMMALRSGLTGEYESLKRYGVVINEATLAEIAHQKGIKKKVTAMTVAEKTELRYAAIMERTKAARGDAIRTSDGFANASKALRAALKDVGIGMAKNVIPALEKVVRFARDAIKWFNEMAKNTKILQAAFVVLGAAALVLGAEFYAAFIGPTLALMVLIVLVDELMTLFAGGETAIGRLINAMAGEGAAQEWVRNMIAGFSILGEVLGGAWDTFQKTWADAGGWSGIISTVQGFWQDFGIKLGDWAAAVGDAITWPFRKLGEVLYKLSGGKIGSPDAIPERSYERAAGRGMGAGVADFNTWRVQREQERNQVVQRGEADAAQLRQRAYATGRGLGAGVSDAAGVRAVSGAPGTVAAPPTSAAPGAVTAPATATPVAGAAAPSGAAAPGAAAPVIVPVNTAAPVVNVHTNNPDVVARAVKKALEEHRKSQMAALPRQGGT